MKAKVFIVVTMILACCKLNAEILTHLFEFDETDFVIESTNCDSMTISSKRDLAVYPYVTGPCIPMFCKSLALPGAGKINNIAVTYNKRLISEGIVLDNPIQPIPTNVSIKNSKHLRTPYEQKVYPDSNCVLAQVYNVGGVNVANFLMTPFVYNAEVGALYFIESMQLDIDLESDGRRKSIMNIKPRQLEMLEAIVDNDEILENIPVATSVLPLEERCDYVIITCDSLKNAFQPLADWKRKKGVPSKIITIEQINTLYADTTQQIRIKRCLKELSENNGTEFVLLGGDVNIVPSQPCYVQTYETYDDKTGRHRYTAEDIPADVYYSCLEGFLDWDRNHDGRVGDPEHDNVNIVPSVAVSRAPVRNTLDVNVFVNRTINYEKSPNSLYAFFQGGGRLDARITGKMMADKLFSNVIVGKVILESIGFFDNYTYSGEAFNINTFTDELSKGYQFVDIQSHGSAYSWSGDCVFFNAETASVLENDGYSLITTTACNSNAFDAIETDQNPKPCLSEALFRNSHSGMVGFVGSSRAGWYSRDLSKIEYSLAYDVDFYKRMLYSTQQPYDKNLGMLVNFMKHTYLAAAYQDRIYRWLHYAINVIGDPETPICTYYPYEMALAKVECNDFGLVTVDSGLEDTKICISNAITTHGASGNRFEINIPVDSVYEIKYGKQVSFNLSSGGIYDIWITKQNYKPKHLSVTYFPENRFNPELPIDIKPRILSISPNPASDYVTIEFVAPTINSVLKLSLVSVDLASNYVYDIDNPDGNFTLNISNIPNGVYVVNLIVNDKIYPASTRLIKQ